MKTLRDGTEVSAQSYYFLLEWNEKDGFKTLQSLGRVRLYDCTIEEYATLWAIASDDYLKELCLQTHSNQVKSK